MADGQGKRLLLHIAWAFSPVVTPIESTLQRHTIGPSPLRTKVLRLADDSALDKLGLSQWLQKRTFERLCPPRSNRTGPVLEDSRSLRRYRHAAPWKDPLPSSDDAGDRSADTCTGTESSRPSYMGPSANLVGAAGAFAGVRRSEHFCRRPFGDGRGLLRTSCVSCCVGGIHE